jgi:caffeoyl-CoA O-methyltransferase
VHPLLPREVDGYLVELVKAQHADQVLTEMESRADELGFPIVGRAVGRFLELQARAIGARRVVELGSGYGYSAYWFARAVGEDGEVVCTDADPDNARLAEGYLRRAGLWAPVRYHVGDALEGLAAWTASWTSSTATSTRTATRTRGPRRPSDCASAGCSCATTCCGTGGSPGLAPEGEPASVAASRGAVTDAIVAMSREIASDPRYVSSVVPIRDGVLVALRVA